MNTPVRNQIGRAKELNFYCWKCKERIDEKLLKVRDEGDLHIDIICSHCEGVIICTHIEPIGERKKK